MDQRRPDHPRYQPCPRSGCRTASQSRSGIGPRARPAAQAAKKRSWASSTKAAWACITPLSKTNCLNPTGIYKERLSQSALVAAMRLVSDDEAQQVRDWLEARGMTFVHGHGRSHRTDRRADPPAVQDVYCGGAHRPCLWLRDDRHPIPAGPERYGPGLRSGRRSAEQRRAPACL